MIDDLVRKIKEVNPHRVFVQLPEGLLMRSQELHDRLFQEGIVSFISLEPCYGACDLRDCEAERLNCDLLVHVGHSDFGLKSRVPVLYYEWRIDFDPVPVLEKYFYVFNEFEKMGLVSSVNYLDSLNKAKDYLESYGKKCYIGKGFRTKYPGQILGCDVAAGTTVENQVDCFLFIGSGKFHPMGLALKTSKPVFSLDVEKREIMKVEKDKFIRQREVAKSLFKDCDKVGIFVSTKPGQQMADPVKVKKMLERKGKKAYIFVMDRITPEKLMGLDVDCYINCACPRVAIENRTSFEKPIVNYDELT